MIMQVDKQERPLQYLLSTFTTLTHRQTQIEPITLKSSGTMKISTYTIKGGLPHCSMDGKVEAYDIVMHIYYTDTDRHKSNQ